MAVFRLIASAGRLIASTGRSRGEAAGENAGDVTRRAAPVFTKVRPVTRKSAHPDETDIRRHGGQA